MKIGDVVIIPKKNRYGEVVKSLEDSERRGIIEHIYKNFVIVRTTIGYCESFTPKEIIIVKKECQVKDTKLTETCQVEKLGCKGCAYYK